MPPLPSPLDPPAESARRRGWARPLHDRGGYLFPNAKVVRIDTQPRGLWQGLRTADLHVQADAKAAAEAIVSRLKERGISRRGWRSNEIATKIATTAENPDPKRYTPTPGTPDPRPVVKELDAAVVSHFEL